MTADDWTAHDLYTPRADVPGHTVSSHAAGSLFVISCECGWTSKPLHLSNIIAAENRHRIEVADQHEHGRETSGNYIRLACSCGHRGSWHVATGRTIEQLLGSDDNTHIFATRRQGA